MKNKLESIINRYNTIEKLMADQEILSNPEKLKEIAKEHKQLEPIVITGIEYIKVLDQIVEDVEIGDLTAIEELLRTVPIERLIAYLPEDLED